MILCVLFEVCSILNAILCVTLKLPCPYYMSQRLFVLMLVEMLGRCHQLRLPTKPQEPPLVVAHDARQEPPSMTEQASSDTLLNARLEMHLWLTDFIDMLKLNQLPSSSL